MHSRYNKSFTHSQKRSDICKVLEHRVGKWWMNTVIDVCIWHAFKKYEKWFPMGFLIGFEENFAKNEVILKLKDPRYIHAQSQCQWNGIHFNNFLMSYGTIANVRCFGNNTYTSKHSWIHFHTHTNTYTWTHIHTKAGTSNVQIELS